MKAKVQREDSTGRPTTLAITRIVNGTRYTRKVDDNGIITGPKEMIMDLIEDPQMAVVELSASEDEDIDVPGDADVDDDDDDESESEADADTDDEQQSDESAESDAD